MIVVSSAKRIKLESVLVFGKSLMYGTYCCLFERYNARRSLEITEIPKYESLSNNIS